MGHLQTCAALWIVLICAVRPKLRVPVILSLPCFITFLICWSFYESRTLARLSGLDMSKPSLRDALETYIETGEGNPGKILSAGHPMTIGYTELKRYLGT